MRRAAVPPALVAGLLAVALAIPLTACGDDDVTGPDASTPGAGPGTTLTTSAAATVGTQLATGPVSDGPVPTAAAVSTAATRSTATVTPGAGPATGTVVVATESLTVPGPTTAR